MPKCKAGYRPAGSLCVHDCSAYGGKWTNCGMGCAPSKEECAKNVYSQARCAPSKEKLIAHVETHPSVPSISICTHPLPFIPIRTHLYPYPYSPLPPHLSSSRSFPPSPLVPRVVAQQLTTTAVWVANVVIPGSAIFASRMSAIGAPVAMSYGGVKGVARMTRGPDAMIARKTMEKRALVAMLTAAHARRLDKNGGAVGIFSPRTQARQERWDGQNLLPWDSEQARPPTQQVGAYPYPLFILSSPSPSYPPSSQPSSPPSSSLPQNKPARYQQCRQCNQNKPARHQQFRQRNQNKPARYQQFRQRNQVSTQMATRVADVMVRAVRKDKAAVNIEDLAKYDPSGTLPMLVAYSHPLCSKSECFECRTFLHLLYLPLLYLPLSSISGALPSTTLPGRFPCSWPTATPCAAE
ncbi:unnamed protein product [Closterium sp. NIES-65]|nr:unnamed protein product [Closterium sp. NIES-65]